MTGDIVNLRRRRKSKARDLSRAEADENVARHGQARSVRSLREAQAELDAKRLEGHRRADAGRDADEPE